MLTEFSDFLKSRKYALKTQRNYLSRIKSISSYRSNRPVERFTIQDIRAYIRHLDNMRLSPQTINVSIHALECFYNDFLGRDLDLKSISKPPMQYADSEMTVLTPKEVKLLISCIKNEKHRTIITIAYSSGLTLQDVVDLKIRDVDIKGKFIRLNTKGKPQIRKVVSEKAFRMLGPYLKKYHPTEYLFEGYKPGEPLSTRSVQLIFSRALKKSGCSKNATFKDLRHSFVIHLRDMNFPLYDVLEELGIQNATSVYRYSKVNVEGKVRIVSPFDLLADDDYEKVSITKLENLTTYIHDEDDLIYFQEAVRAANSGAKRSAVMLLWILAVTCIQKKCLKNINEFNLALKKHVPKSRTIKSIDDFENIKESKLLLAAQEIRLIDKSKKQILEQCLNVRNKCSHPGQYIPSATRVISFAEDIVNIVFK